MKPAHWVGFLGFKETIKPEFWTNTLRKSFQTASTSPCRIYVTDFVSSIYNLKTVFLADFVSSICNLKTVFLADFVSLIYNLKIVF